MIANLFLDLLRPVFPHVGLDSLSYVRYSVPLFNTNVFVAFLVLSILLLGMIRPRFWCRNLCPAGAIFALFSFRPLFEGRFQRNARAAADVFVLAPWVPLPKISSRRPILSASPAQVRGGLSEKAIAFKMNAKVPHLSPEVNLDRRRALGAGATGLAAAA